jgi:carboxyl-terminal processing protease
MKKLIAGSVSREALGAAVFCCAVALAGCGGSDGPSSPTPAPAPQPALPTSASLANQCMVETEKRYVRSLIDEEYLWYREVPTVDAATFASPYDYFEALKTTRRSASGSLVDKFSFAVPQEQFDLAIAGADISHGVKWKIDQTARTVVAVDVEANSPAGRAGVQRGWKIAAINGTPLTQLPQGAYQEAVAAPSVGITTNFTLLNRQGAQLNFALRAERVDFADVPVTRVLSGAAGPVGFLALRQWQSTSQDALAASIEQLRAAQVRELVVDLRYNEGGALLPVLQLAYMVAGDRVRDKAFARVRGNDKQPAKAADLPALGVKVDVQNQLLLANQPLPTLNVSRVFVLSTAETCSASEAFINGLKPHVDVVQLGATTCGKPYGYDGARNCGKFYAPMDSSISNAAGQGEYSDGIAPRCPVQDDVSRELGDPAEAMVQASLDFIRTGSCPSVSAVQASAMNSTAPPLLLERQANPARSSLRIDRVPAAVVPR